jgi:hypothetical protein
MKKERNNMFYYWYNLGQEAYYDGSACPVDANEKQKEEWNRGWSVSDRRERYRLDQMNERE